MPEPVRGGQRYLPGLDGLRALAVSAVVAYHLGLGWAQGGLLGVGVFFTLSGYLITDILLGHWDKGGTLRLGDFWLRRARRLLPALFVMLTVVAAWEAHSNPSQVPALRGDVVASMLYVSNWWFIAQHASYFAQFGPPSPLDHLWSLAVEEQFYLLWPWLLLLGLHVFARRRDGNARRRDGNGGRYTLAALTLAAAAASAVAMARLYHPGFDPTRAYEGTDARAFGLLIGAALAMLWPTRRASWPAAPEPPRPTAASIALDAAGVAGLAVIVALVWRTTEYSAFMFRGGMVLLSAATAVAVAAAVHPASRLGRLLGCGPLRWLGVRSYGVYLWHYPVIVLTAPALALGGMSATRAVATVAGIVAIAAVSWRYVEEPIRRGALGARPSPSPSASPSASPRERPRPLPRVKGGPVLTASVLSLAVLACIGLRMMTGHPAAKANLAQAGPGVTVRHPAGAPGAAAVAGMGAGRGTGPGAGAGAGTRARGRGYGVPARGAAGGAEPDVDEPLRTSCTSVVHLGDSTSEGLVSSDYLPNARQRITARYAQIGVRSEYMEISGGSSIIETINNQPNMATVASGLVRRGYRGCWVVALGTNDTADVYVGSPVGRLQRIERLMSIIGGQPVMWVNVKSLLAGGPYSEQDMQLWNQTLAQAQARYPNMRVYDWAAVVQNGWFIKDGIHYTSAGYGQRARLIADGLAEAFPAGGEDVSATSPARSASRTRPPARPSRRCAGRACRRCRRAPTRASGSRT